MIVVCCELLQRWAAVLLGEDICGRMLFVNRNLGTPKKVVVDAEAKRQNNLEPEP